MKKSCISYGSASNIITEACRPTQAFLDLESHAPWNAALLSFEDACHCQGDMEQTAAGQVEISAFNPGPEMERERH